MGKSRRPDRGRSMAFLGAILGLGITLLACAGCPAPADPRAAGERSPGSADTAGGSGGKDESGNTTERSGPPLRLLFVDDPEFATAFEREWRSVSEEPLEIQRVAGSELGPAFRLPPADGVVFPIGLLGTLAETGQIVPLPAAFWDGDRLARRELLETARKREAFWGQQPYAVPLGSNLPVLLYRKDLFEALKLTPPRDWQEFQIMAERLRERPESPGAVAATEWHGVLEPLAPGSAAVTLLIRAAAYVRHPNQYSTLFDLVTMTPRIDGPPFLRALEELQAVYAMNPGPALERDVHAVRRELLAGHAAAAICWPQPATASSQADATKPSESPLQGNDSEAIFGVAMLPGARDVFNADQRQWEPRPADEQRQTVPLWAISGRLGGVMATSRRAGPAANLLALLATADWGRKVLMSGQQAGVSRIQQLERPDDWVDAQLAGEAAREFAIVVGDSQRLPAWMAVPRIPGRDRYLATLDEAVRKAVRGEKSTGEALAEAAQQWNTITTELGKDAQKKAYRRCLGVEP